MKFCTAINCMDGRVQQPVIDYLKDHFQCDVVDMITEPGPNRILSEHKDSHLVGSILARLKISLEKHDSKQIAVIGHFDCAGNSGGQDEQAHDTESAVDFLKSKLKNIEVIGVWVDENWDVIEI